MRARRTASALVLSLLAIAGCSTVPIPEPYVIPLPAGMTSQQAEVAVICGILNTTPPGDYDPTVTLPDEQFRKLVWVGFVGSAKSRSWFPESRDGSTIYAAVNTRGHYLRAAIEQQPTQIRLSIAESRELDQANGRIHEAAVKWMRNLDAHIRREVGRMAMMVSATRE